MNEWAKECVVEDSDGKCPWCGHAFETLALVEEFSFAEETAICRSCHARLIITSKLPVWAAIIRKVFRRKKWPGYPRRPKAGC